MARTEYGPREAATDATDEMNPERFSPACGVRG